MKYILVDASNSFFRARHVAARGADQWTKLGYAIHITLSSIHKAVRDFGGDHVVLCLEGRSWRKDFYPPYKRNRSLHIAMAGGLKRIDRRSSQVGTELGQQTGVRNHFILQVLRQRAKLVIKVVVKEYSPPRSQIMYPSTYGVKYIFELNN